MKFGIDIKALSDLHPSGIGNYVFNLVTNLAIIDKDNQFNLFSDKNKLRSIFPENFRFVKRKNIIQLLKPLDVFHGPDFKLLPVRAKKFVVTIHDAAGLMDEDFMSDDFKLLTRKKILKAVNKADTIITVSGFIKDQLSHLFPQSANKIKTVYHGVGKEFYYIEDINLKEKVKDLYKIPESFILFVGNLEKRKNIINLLKAYKILREKYGINYKLVMIGKGGYKYEEIELFIKNNFTNDELILPGWIRNEHLPAIYSMAEVFVFPSFYEGFGLPLLEAMKCKASAVLSDIPVFREIAEDAGLYVNPFDEHSIAEGINKLLNDKNLKLSLVSKGLERVKDFTWEETAKETLKIYKDM